MICAYPGTRTSGGIESVDPNAAGGTAKLRDADIVAWNWGFIRG